MSDFASRGAPQQEHVLAASAGPAPAPPMRVVDAAAFAKMLDVEILGRTAAMYLRTNVSARPRASRRSRSISASLRRSEAGVEASSSSQARCTAAAACSKARRTSMGGGPLLRGGPVRANASRSSGGSPRTPASCSSASQASLPRRSLATATVTTCSQRAWAHCCQRPTVSSSALIDARSVRSGQRAAQLDPGAAKPGAAAPHERLAPSRRDQSDFTARRRSARPRCASVPPP